MDMQYDIWHKKVVKKIQPVSDLVLYFRALLFGLAVFGVAYGYTAWSGIPNMLNKSVADTASILIGISMLLSSLCYFWDFVDSKIVYRKHLGLVGFAFGVTHIILSFSALQSLFVGATWQRGIPWPLLTAAVATLIFSIMAAISNQYAARELGGRLWRGILRFGYVAVLLIWAHVVLLKMARWETWFNAGMKTPPSMSLLVTLFITVVLIMRVALWYALKRKK